MESVKAALNRAFEALGSDIRAYVEDGTVVVRDLVAFDLGDGNAEVFEASSERSLFVMPMGDGLASAMALHVARKVIANAIG